MSLARDFARFTRAVNADLDKVVNDMAEQSKRVDDIQEEKNELLAGVFGKLGGIEEALKRIVPAVESFDRRLTLLQEAQVNTARDHGHRLLKLENHGTHPDEEVTPPTARPALHRR